DENQEYAQDAQENGHEALLRQLHDNRLHHRRCRTDDRISLPRCPGDMDVLSLLAVLFPGIGDFHRPEAAAGLAIIGVDAEIEEPRGVATGSGVADLGL